MEKKTSRPNLEVIVDSLIFLNFYLMTHTHFQTQNKEKLAYQKLPRPSLK